MSLATEQVWISLAVWGLSYTRNKDLVVCLLWISQVISMYVQDGKPDPLVISPSKMCSWQISWHSHGIIIDFPQAYAEWTIQPPIVSQNGPWKVHRFCKLKSIFSISPKGNFPNLVDFPLTFIFSFNYKMASYWFSYRTFWCPPVHFYCWCRMGMGVRGRAHFLMKTFNY